jgi:hypothetical protein
MQAIVKNFRGIQEAHISISSIALICGLNGAGKTSIARAVAAAATGKPIPYAKVTKKDCGILLRHGTKAGMAAIGTNEQGCMQIEWPKAEAHSVGTPPFASEIAAGITDLFTMAPKDALAYLINLLKAAPTLEDITAAFEKEGFQETAKVAEAVWKSIEEKGWDGAHARAKEKGSELKGGWQQITGTAYGKKKADEWYPDNWEDNILKEDHDATLQDLKSQLETAIGKSAVNKAEHDRLQQLVDRLPALEEAANEALSNQNKARTALDEASENLRATPNPSAIKDYSCPHCEGLVHITAVSGTEYLLAKAEKIDEKKLKAARTAYAGLCGEQQRLSGEFSAAAQSADLAQRGHEEALRAKNTLEGFGDNIADDNQGEVTALRSRIAAVEQRKGMASKFREATKAAVQIATNQIIIDALDETGIRKQKLATSLDAFAVSYMHPLCKDLGVSEVMIDADLNVIMGEVSYPMLSASEQFRVRTILQLAIAMLENSSLVIIDGADILDKPSRKNLLQMLMNCKMHAIICMTMNKPDGAPDLQKAGIGITYWVENGTCQPISEVITTTIGKAAA